MSASIMPMLNVITGKTSSKDFSKIRKKQLATTVTFIFPAFTHTPYLILRSDYEENYNSLTVNYKRVVNGFTVVISLCGSGRN